MLKSFIKYSRHAENFSPRYFLTKKEYVPFVTETRKLNPVLHRKNSIKYLSSSSDKDKGKVKENGGIEFDIGNRRKINVVLYKGDIKIDIRQYYKDDHGEDKPGTRGISLKPEEWNKLKSLIEEVDEAVTNLED